MPNWTEEQQKVIDTRNKNILVSAAAGSGKTAVLVERIIQRIIDTDNPLDIDRLLVVTFTNAAAAEMRERILKAIEAELSKTPDNRHLQKQQAYIHNAQITTIHSFCLGLVKEHFDDVDLDPSVKVADAGEMELLKSDVVKEVLEQYYEAGNSKFYNFIAQFEGKNSDSEIESMILTLYSKSMGYPWPDEWLNECVEKYRADSIDELIDGPFILLINEYADGVLKEAISQCELMLSLCTNGGPEIYKERISEEKRELEEILAEKNFDKRCTKLNLDFQTLPRCKAGSCDEDMKKLVTDYRKGIKASLKKLKEKMYFQNTETFLEEMKKCLPIVEMYVELTKAFIKKFKEKKLDKNVIDFSDFEHYAIEILVKKENDKIIPTAVADELAAGFDEVMIDEYQDSNLVQETILSSVSKNRQGIFNRFMVGDVKQSIYGFRGAKPDIFIEKYNAYRTDGSDDAGYKIILDKNFRSRESVINSTNFIFTQIMSEKLGGINYDEENRLNPGAVFKDTDSDIQKGRVDYSTELVLINTSSDNSYDEDVEDEESDNADVDEDVAGSSGEIEAKAIAGRIRELVNPDSGLLIYDKDKDKYRTAKYSDIVILLRGISGVGEIINDELMKAGIPAHMESKSGYFKTLEIRTIISFLKIIDNPMQDIPLAAVLKSPIAGIDDEELAIIRSAGGRDKSLYENMCDYDSNSAELKDKLEKFINLLNDFRVKITYMSIYDILCEVLNETGYYNYVSAMPSGDRRQANIDMLKEKAAAYEQGSYKGLFNFIRYIEKMDKYEVDMGEASIISDSEDAVRIMTIHKSKGLEFPIVFVSNINKQFNVMEARARSVMHFDLGLGMDYVDEDTRIRTKNLIKTAINTRIQLDTIEEEMRLFYVACTRAKEKLIFTASGITDKKIEKMASQRMNENEYLGYGIISQSKSFLDFISYSLGRNKAFEQLYKKIICIQPETENPMYYADSNIIVKYINATDIFTGVIKEKADVKNNIESLKNLPFEIVYNEKIRKRLEDNLEFSYPYQSESEQNAKMSVSEIKKIAYESEESYETASEQFITSLEEIKDKSKNTEPEFISGTHNLAGAARGTAYHTVFELFDFDVEPSKENIINMIDNMQKAGRLSAEERKAVSIEDIQRFASSSLGKRMKSAYERGELYREAQFVMGISEGIIEEYKNIAKSVGENGIYIKPEQINHSGDTVLIQGIIDVYFIENGKVIIADYKTDRVDSIEELKKHYYVQLELYSHAVEQITGMKVSEKILYSVKLSDELHW